MSYDSGINHYSYVLDHVGSGTLGKVLVRNYGYSSRLLNQIKRIGQVLVNGEDCWMNEPVAVGDRVEITFPQESIDIVPVEGSMDILYEDDEIMAVNKDPFCVTHPTKSHQLDTLGNHVAWYWQENNQQAKVRFVNRLDRDTSGIVVIAKNKYVHHYLQSERKIEKVVKRYVAVVHGVPPSREGIIDAPIGLTEADGIMRAVIPEGKPSVTHYRVLEDYGVASLLSLELATAHPTTPIAPIRPWSITLTTTASPRFTWEPWRAFQNCPTFCRP